MAARKTNPDHKNVKVTHIMADGTVRDSVKGCKVPYNETTAVAYRILALAGESLKTRLMNV